MNKKDKKIIIRINSQDDKMIEDIRNNHNINISSLIRKLLADYYKDLKKKNENL